MARLFQRMASGVAKGLGAGLLARAEVKREDEIRRQQRQWDIEDRKADYEERRGLLGYEDELATARADREHGQTMEREEADANRRHGFNMEEIGARNQGQIDVYRAQRDMEADDIQRVETDSEGNLIGITRNGTVELGVRGENPRLDSAMDRAMEYGTVPSLDANGNPILDREGDPVMALDADRVADFLRRQGFDDEADKFSLSRLDRAPQIDGPPLPRSRNAPRNHRPTGGTGTSAPSDSPQPQRNRQTEAQNEDFQLPPESARVIGQTYNFPFGRYRWTENGWDEVE